MKLLRFAVAALLFAVLPLAASAQTSPNLTKGQVLTAGQWNALFAGKQDTLGYTPLNSAGGTMTGRLITAASSTSAAGFNIPPGVSPSSPVNGDLWSTTAGFFARVNGTTVGPFGGGGGRTALLADTTFWRRSDGSNSVCNGTANFSSASAPNCAYLGWNPLYAAVIAAYDFNGHGVTLKSGTTDTITGSNVGLTINNSWVGGGFLAWDLNGSSVAETGTKGFNNNVVLPGGVTIQNTAGLGVGGNISSSGFACIQNSAPAAIGIGIGISTGPCFDAAYEVIQGGYIALSFPVNSIGSGGNEYVLVAEGTFGFNGQTVNVNSNQTYSVGYASAQANGVIYANSAVFTLGGNTVTGPRYYSTSGGEIFTGGAGDTFFPGSLSGVRDNGGIYDNTMGVRQLFGGSAAGDNLFLNSTSNVSPSGDSVIINGSTILLRSPSGVASSIQFGTAGSGSSTVLFSGSTSGFEGLKAPAVASGTSTLPSVAGTLATTGVAILQGSPTDPTGTTTELMMGLGVSTCKLTPVQSTRVHLEFQGQAQNASGGGVVSVQARYGSGTAPANAAALTGFTLGSKPHSLQNTANEAVMFRAGGNITGLTVGTAYWFDLAVSNVGTGTTASITNVSCDAFEIP